MNWWLCLLWLFSGLIVGAIGIVYAMGHSLGTNYITRLSFLRVLAQHWPDDMRRALLDQEVLGHDEEKTDPEFTPIEFYKCELCGNPWTLDLDGHALPHIDLADPPGICAGKKVQ